MKITIGIITHWNTRRGFGFTACGVFVHANTLCEHLYPQPGAAVPNGTEVHMSVAPASEKRHAQSSLSMCATCAERRHEDHITTKRDFVRAMRLLTEVEALTADPRILARTSDVRRCMRAAMRLENHVVIDVSIAAE